MSDNQNSNPMTAEHVAVIMELWPTDIRVIDIAEKIGCCEETVRIRAKKLGLEKRVSDWWEHEGRIDFLRENHAIMTGQQLADKLGTSRNAIIGKARRLGLPNKPHANGMAQVKKRTRVAELKLPAAEPKLPAIPVAVEFIPRVDVVAVKRISFFDLKLTHCRWPCDEADGPFTYCGHRVIDGQSYCRDHYCMSYNPTSRTARPKGLV